MTIKQLFPTQRPALDLNFARQKRLDSRVTFTRASTGTYVGSDGLIKTAADNEARFDHDPATGESLGLLIEKGTTNLLPHSNEFDYTDPNNPGASWVLKAQGAGGTTPVLTPTYTTGLDGTNTAWRLQCNLTSGTTTTDQSLLRGPFLNYSTHCTGSIWVKSNTGTNQTFMFTVHQSSGSVFTATPEWTRIDATWVVNPNMRIGFQGDITGPGSCDISIWGAQVEPGDDVITSYIPTNGSTVTRSADVASLTNSGIYDTDSFTILNEPFGSAAGASTLSLVGAGETPIKRTAVYSQDLTQTQINASVGKTDEFWRWRILGTSFGLPEFSTDGQVTVDWGDGTVQTLNTSTHPFTDGGGYHDIGFRLDSGTYFRPQINNNSNHDTKLVAVGPAPESMKVDLTNIFYGASNLVSIDSTISLPSASNQKLKESMCSDCSSLKSFPYIDFSGASSSSIRYAWRNCTSMESFPLLDLSQAWNLGDGGSRGAWNNCSALKSFPAIHFPNVLNAFTAWAGCSSMTEFEATGFGLCTTFYSTWSGCSSLTSFPLIDTSSGTNFYRAWYNCSSLTSFPAIDMSSGTDIREAWHNCTSLTSFPLIDTSSNTSFNQDWRNCSSLTSFPANFFDSWTGTPADYCFNLAWDGCTSLTATSVENILNSIDTSGQSAPGTGPDITIDYDAGTGTPSVATAVTNLKSRGWTITLNGVAQ